MSDENVEVVRSSFDAWNRGDIDTWLGWAHPDIEFRTSGLYPGTDPLYRGMPDCAASGPPSASLGSRFKSAPISTWVGDDVVVLGTVQGHARDGIASPRSRVGLAVRQRPEHPHVYVRHLGRSPRSRRARE